MRCAVMILALALCQAASTALAAGDPEAGESKAQICSGCHGSNGVSPNDLWPNLAGQQPRYFVQAMRAYRDGSRNDPMMETFVRDLSDEDFEDMAAWYASLNCRGE